ncbi:MAG: hypothetical protein P8X57_10270 [Cyclobacteriaceae bacterium]
MNYVAERLKNMELYRLVERILAGFCLFIPLVLMLVENNGNESFSIRPSISDYVYMDKSFVFGSLLTIAALLFFFNGILHFRDESRERKKPQAKWYNAVLGLSLFGVIFFPYKELPVPHYISAVIFFGGSILVIALFCDHQDRRLSWILAALASLSYILYFLIPDVFGKSSLFWAEWISLTVIGIHFILESLQNR